MNSFQPTNPLLLLWLYVLQGDIYPQVQLSLGDFVAARRSLKKALLLGSQQPLDRQAVKKSFKYGERAIFIPTQSC